ncbi:MAG: DUF2809 domain-containing protein [Candidatus Riflebacteria bacterium]
MTRIKLLIGMMATVFLGLFSRKIAGLTGVGALLYVGDALWAMMVYQCILFVSSNIEEKKAAILCMVISFAVEFGQLIHQPDLDRFRQTRIGHMILGNGFDSFDLLAYFLGIMTFYLIREFFRKRFLNNGQTEKNA